MAETSDVKSIRILGITLSIVFVSIGLLSIFYGLSYDEETAKVVGANSLWIIPGIAGIPIFYLITRMHKTNFISAIVISISFLILSLITIFLELKAGYWTLSNPNNITIVKFLIALIGSLAIIFYLYKNRAFLNN